MTSATREALNTVWNELLTRQEAERQRVAGVLNAMSGHTRTADEALAELDRGLRALIPMSDPDPVPLDRQGHPHIPSGQSLPMSREQINAMAVYPDPEAQLYLDKLRG